jgi:hypothetical protein
VVYQGYTGTVLIEELFIDSRIRGMVDGLTGNKKKLKNVDGKPQRKISV